MTGSEQFQYTARSLTGTYDTRHEAVGSLTRNGDWENDTVVPITENCLVSQVTSIRVGPVHLGDRHWKDRQKYPTTHGVAQIKRVSLVKEVNGNRASVKESWWATDCPVCHSRIEVQGASEDSRRELLEELLDCCDIEWFPPSDWIEDCEICGESHRESNGCMSLTYREPFPSPEEHHYDCSECEWSGEGDDFEDHFGHCPDCGTSAVQALPVATDGGVEQPGKEQPDQFLTDRIPALYEGEEITIWNSVIVREHHDVEVNSIESKHSILVGDGSLGRNPEYITPAVEEQLRTLDVYPAPTVLDPRDEEVTIL